MPNTIVYRAKRFITMDGEKPSATAIAVRDGRFIAVGSYEEVVADIDSEFTVSNEFAEKIVMPGLIDQHLHPLLGASTLTTEIIAPEDWNLPRQLHKAALTPSAYVQRLRSLNTSLPAGEWLFSWGYHSLWHGKIDRQLLDEIAGERPVAIWQRSCHEWFLNSAALTAIGLSEEMTRDQGIASEQLNWERGHFYENGWMVLLARYLLPFFLTRERMRKGLIQMVEYLHMNGVTAINEPGICWRNEPWDLYQEELGKPEVPFESTFFVEARTQPVRELEPGQFISDAQEQVERGKGTKVRVLDRHVKLFADGAIISQLMQMKDPYLDEEGLPDHNHHGEWLMEPDELKKVFDVYWDADWQIHIHVNGDLGLEVVLKVIEEAMRRKHRDDHRTVIVHFANSTEEQVARISKVGAIISANPYYPVGFADKYGEWGLGAKRADSMVRAASAVRHKIPLSFHSDLPMCPSDPLMMASYAVNRMTPSGRVAGPEQRIDVDTALRAVTIESAFSWNREHDLGSITRGKIANLTVLDGDPYEIDPRKLARIPIVSTMFEGKVFEIAADLVAQRINTNYEPADLGDQQLEHVHSPHSCGCEVASFLASYIDSELRAA